MTKFRILVASACFAFTLAFVAVVSTPDVGYSDPCCWIPCEPPMTGPGHWGHKPPHSPECTIYQDPYNCYLRLGGCALP